MEDYTQISDYQSHTHYSYLHLSLLLNEGGLGLSEGLLQCYTVRLLTWIADVGGVSRYSSSQSGRRLALRSHPRGQLESRELVKLINWSAVCL